MLCKSYYIVDLFLIHAEFLTAQDMGVITASYSKGVNGDGRPAKVLPHNFGDYHKDKIEALRPVEAERLQTLPENYTEGVSKYERYKMIGNGWTVDVVAHIFRGLHES